MLRRNLKANRPVHKRPSLYSRRNFCVGRSEAPGLRANIIGLTKEELAQDFKVFKLPEYRIDQLYHWLYAQGVKSFDQMLNLPRDFRKQLGDHYSIEHGQVLRDEIANDGTRKFLIRYGAHDVESVFIPESRRGTLCVSSQVGCSMACTFCHTGTQGLARNLKASEILGQLITVKSLLFDFPAGANKVVSNLVFMGQGEPFYNYRNVKQALQIMSDNNGMAFSRRKITVSTSGIVPNIKKLAEDFPGVALAISLHAANDKLRSELVPANRQYPLDSLMAALKEFPAHAHNRITFEYVLLKGVNDSPDHAEEVVRLVEGLPCLVNLIPFNPWPGSNYECSSKETILEFAQIIERRGIGAPIRWPRGRDILAACGQLKTDNDRRKASGVAL